MSRYYRRGKALDDEMMPSAGTIKEWKMWKPIFTHFISSNRL